MKTFLAFLTGSPQALEFWKQSQLPQQLRERQAAGLEAWHVWVERHSDSIVQDGAPLGRSVSLTKGGMAASNNTVGAFTVVRAATHEEAAQLFLDHPHFTIFPGEGVEIMECLAIPAL
jgi:hypothetical protein